MIAFQGLANVKEATIAMVAPGISEALIATAMGLFAAIPAVGLQPFSTKLERIGLRYDTFVEEFLDPRAPSASSKTDATPRRPRPRWSVPACKP
jgi:biopolymer transport protein ExbB/TolQ